MNNRIGREIGKDSDLSNKDLALKVLNVFRDSGLYTVSQNKDGSYSVGLTTLTENEYAINRNLLEKANEDYLK